METNKQETIKDQLLKLPQGYRELAIKNAEAYAAISGYDGLAAKTETIIRAIHGAFVWEKTPEGDRFWMEVSDHYFDNSSPLPPLPERAEDDRATKVTSEVTNLGFLKPGDKFHFVDDHLVAEDQYYEVINQKGTHTFCFTPSGNKQYYNAGEGVTLWSPTSSHEPKEVHLSSENDAWIRDLIDQRNRLALELAASQERESLLRKELSSLSEAERKLEIVLKQNEQMFHLLNRALITISSHKVHPDLATEIRTFLNQVKL